MKMLDCYCGKGGVSDGFALIGFEVTGIDIHNMPKLGYKHNFIQADMQKLNGEDFKNFDVIWGSPPCRDFSLIGNYSNGWKKPKNVKSGLELVYAFLNFIEKAKPEIWIMENVPKLKDYISMKPKQISWIGTPRKKRAFWGNYPPFLMPLQKLPYTHNTTPQRWTYFEGKVIASWIRSMIPLSCSKAFAQACKQKLEMNMKKIGKYLGRIPSVVDGEIRMVVDDINPSQHVAIIGGGYDTYHVMKNSQQANSLYLRRKKLYAKKKGKR